MQHYFSLKNAIFFFYKYHEKLELFAFIQVILPNSILECENIVTVSDFYIFESDNKYKVQWVPRL